MTKESNQSHWIPLSDLMTGMMLVFMLIAIIFMVRVQQVATDLRDVKGQIYTALDKEFSNDLKKWDAEIRSDLTFRFKNPETLFATGKEKLSPKFEEILENFFPRYLKVVTDPRFDSSIKEILIEGHTSTTYSVIDPQYTKMKSSDEAKRYLSNMDLAQDRANATNIFLYKIVSEKDELIHHEQFMMKKIHLHDVASSYPIKNNDGLVGEQKSQRVDFRIVTNSDERLEEIATSLTSK